MILEIIGMIATTLGLANILSNPKNPISTGVEVEDRVYDMARGLAEFLLKKKKEGLPYDKAKIVEQIARMESNHFKSELLYRCNNPGAVIKSKPSSDTLTVYVKPLYENGKFKRNIITTENETGAKPYHYKVYPTLQEGYEALYNVIVANEFDYKKYSGDKNASLKGIKTPIADSIYKS